MVLFQTLLEAGELPHSTEDLERHESHTGLVFLVGKYAYKIRKPILIEGLVDYSTPGRREHFLKKEIRLNRVFGHDIHLAVVPVFAEGSDRPTLVPRGQPIDYLLKMRRMPTAALLPARFAKGLFLGSREIGRLGAAVSKFHKTCQVVREPCHPRLRKMTSLICEAIMGSFPSRTITDVVRRIEGFTKQHNGLFQSRANNGFVRDVHGDLKLENIFYLDTVFHFFDRLEFDDDLRIQDVALDLAALWVDLQAWEQKTAANDLISVYETRSKDPGIRTVLPYFICLRAILNGYVIAAGQRVHPTWSLAPETYLKIAADVSDAL